MYTEEEVLPDLCWNVRTTSGLPLGIFPPPSLFLLQLYPPSVCYSGVLPSWGPCWHHSLPCFLWLPSAGQPGAGFLGHRDQLPLGKANSRKALEVEELVRTRGWWHLLPQTGTPLSRDQTNPPHPQQWRLTPANSQVCCSWTWPPAMRCLLSDQGGTFTVGGLLRSLNPLAESTMTTIKDLCS